MGLSPIRHARVLLISMPWVGVTEPSLGLGILKSILQSEGIECDVLYLSMRMLRYLKHDTYSWFGNKWAVSDFVFTGAFEKEITAQQIELVREALRDNEEAIAYAHSNSVDIEPYVERVIKMRQEVVPRFLADLMKDIDFSQYCLVGFSCLFDQTISSLALARCIKAQYPNLMLAFGGYALEPPAGPALQASFAEMDVVAYGDGEPVILELVKAALGEVPLESVPNISFRTETGQVNRSSARKKINLDLSPAPNYDDFFEQRENILAEDNIALPVGEIAVESSRGCWWGAKHHCTFCGIDDETLLYRHKSAAVVLDQLDYLNQRYGVRNFCFSDYIMPMQALTGLLPLLRERGAPYVLHYETKANLKDEQIRISAEAGVRYFQPGIESFSSAVLTLMDKGVKGLQNISCLYNMQRQRIYTIYNLLFGFPYETSDSYREMINLLPSLTHFIPPETVVPVLVTRYAPLQTNPERFGYLGKIKAHWRYGMLFTEDFLQKHELSHDHWAYYYDNPYRGWSSEMRELYAVMQHQIIRWKSQYASKSATLSFDLVDDGGITFYDSRFSQKTDVTKFGVAHRRIVELMRGRVWRVDLLCRAAAEAGLSEREAMRAVSDLRELRFCLTEGEEAVFIAFDRRRDTIANLEEFSTDEVVTDVARGTRVKPSSSWRGRPFTLNRSRELALEGALIE